MLMIQIVVNIVKKVIVLMKLKIKLRIYGFIVRKRIDDYSFF